MPTLLISFKETLKMKKRTITSLTAALCLALLTACSPEDSQNTSSFANLNKALNVASNTMTSFEQKDQSSVNKDNAMDVFSKDYAKNLNNTPELAKLGPMGVKPESDGSFVAFSDANKNNIKDAGEKDLFKVEADAQNQRLVASDESNVVEQPHSGMMNGFLMGMLLSNMMGRQRSAGVNPASRRATPPPRKSSGFKSSPSAKSRAGSGSFSSGK